ncbi:long-chain-fatty-acid--CoA ligase [Mycobacterium sp. CPCC 205372]|uniref:Long-chain-fatty-acid--CoA ligase n=1 Tax=Mycobacterium hippophais TaxID=3016340 RepID=A0ABT4PS17_9MYCO|nr:long-chain-fatty-acid--CoA ligase [Mycobacterium hippophais]MCZ8379362.1 long-chain-fatty-acid--CoA ligase [Mycobacterium hippophais]
MSRFSEAIAAAAQNSGKGLRVVRPDGRNTHLGWSDVRDRAQHIAGALHERGVGPGDRLAALVSDPSEVAPLVQAVWMRGAAITMLQQPTPRADLQAWVQSTLAMVGVLDPRLCVLGGQFVDLAATLRDAGVVTAVVDDLDGGSPIAAVSCDEEADALLQLSSGSTGTPKVVAITHRGMFENWSGIAGVYGVEPSDVLVSWLPLFHDLGMNIFMAGPMQSGMDVVTVSPDYFLTTPSIWPELITEYRGTMTGGPNFAYAVMARTLATADRGAFDLSHLRIVVSGGEPIDAGTLRRLVDAGSRFGLRETSFVVGYGMAEATLGICGTHPGSPIPTETIDVDRLESDGYAAVAPLQGGYRRREMVVLGRPVPGMGVRVVDESGDRLPPRSVGELQIRGGAVTKRFRTVDGWQDACDSTGWLATGDLGYLTDAGEIVICGRKKDTIIVAGRKLFPTHIEWAAGQIDGVRSGNAAAVRITVDEREHFAVVVESRAHTDADQVARMRQAITLRVLEEVGIAPKNVLVVGPGQVPKTSSGKVRRTAAAALLDVVTEPATGAR